MKRLWNWIRRSIRSLWLWFPVLFSDRWFDSSYLLTIIERKCKHDAKMYVNHGHCQDHMAVASDLREVAALCKRLKDVDVSYYDKYYDEHKEKWKEAHCPSCYARSVESVDAERKDFRELMDKGTAELQVDLDRFGELFKKVLTWSD